MMAFALLGWFTLSMFLDMKADWSQKYVDYAWWISLPSIPGIVCWFSLSWYWSKASPHLPLLYRRTHCTDCDHVLVVHHAMSVTWCWDTTGPKRSKAELLAEVEAEEVITADEPISNKPTSVRMSTGSIQAYGHIQSSFRCILGPQDIIQSSLTSDISAPRMMVIILTMGLSSGSSTTYSTSHSRSA